MRVALTVYRGDESDWPRTKPSFRAPGPLSVRSEDLLLDVVSGFDGSTVTTRVRLVLPDAAGGPWPLLLFHRGRGFDEDSYRRLHEHIASYGIAVASIEDRLSFSGDSFRATNDRYDLWRAELGMESASSVVEAVSDSLLDRSAAPGDPLWGLFSADALFFAGHSRGGGAVHASHQRSWELRLRGLIYLMPFDLRYFADVRPPARPPAYSIFAEHPRTPSLVIAAENDGDLTYPIADQLIDRATGPMTQVTIYGAVHNLISDAHAAEGRARISRRSEQSQVADWIVCFVRRWADLDTSLDWRLYGGGHQGDPLAAVTSWRPSQRTLVLEDAQDGDVDHNLLGRNLVAGLRRRELSSYPPVGDMGSLGLRHVFLTPTRDVSAWRLETGGPLDASRHVRLVLRLSQTGDYGWSGLALWARLIDAAGESSWYRIHDPVSGGLLPAWDGRSPHDRMLDVHLPLEDFFPASGSSGADRTRLAAVDLFLLRRDSGRVRSVVADDLRFE
ncbi:MAG: hypothetical protein D6731_01985 [Planctomycetota bacterium]|nr:MAG: hypothetical protein D6731_01985 [Planctomycetota bacterium]